MSLALDLHFSVHKIASQKQNHFEVLQGLTVERYCQHVVIKKEKIIFNFTRTRCYDFTASINSSNALESRGSWKARKNWPTPTSIYSLILCAMVSGLPTKPCLSI